MFDVIPATKEDMAEVATIAASWKVDQLDNIDEGFLVSNYTLKDYEESFDKAHSFWKVMAEGDIVGFVYGYYSEDISSDDTVNQIVKYNMYERFFLIKQVCIKRGSPKSKGAASALYGFLQTLNVPLIAAIVTDPLNVRSISFHERLGFKQILSLMPPKDFDDRIRKRGIWAWYSEDAKKSIRTIGIEKEVIHDNIIDYHANAVALYTHEDNLNWTKFGLNVTFLFALIASVPYLTGAGHEGGIQKILAMLVIVMGMAINYLFARKIKSGLHYMNHHKDRVKEIERKIGLKYGYGAIVNTDDQKVRGRSDTANLMNYVPEIINLVWISTSFLIVYKVFY